ncbi:hypothetical protein V5O48_008248 [Marasmius crinis-equi]|uniref:MYND-type domain-containing protein n=1 Tax=Marasmius crinis-equi TaxID=585013 RepID=A0ABR3FEG1_9AGAR
MLRASSCPMNNSARVIRKYLNSKPPRRPHPDKLDQKSERALLGLVELAEELHTTITPTPPIRSLTEEWESKVWPWILTWSRSILDNAYPTTVEGNDAVEMFLTAVPVLLVYPTLNPNVKYNRDATLRSVRRLLDSTPEILAVATEMWFCASEIGLSPMDVDTIATSAGLLLDSHTFESCTRDRSLTDLKITGKVGQFFERVLKSERWDIARVLVGGIPHALSQRSTMVLTIGARLTFMTTLMYLPNPPHNSDSQPHARDFTSQGGVRWTTAILARLSSPSWSDPQDPNFVFAADCVRKSLVFIFWASYHDTYAMVSALEQGLLVYIFKLREIMLNDTILDLISLHLLHRPVWIRVVKSIRKIQKLGLQTEVDAPQLYNDKWNLLKSEAMRRYALVKNLDRPRRLCGNPDCPRGLVQLDTDHYSSYFRCSGCKIETYCSRECQKSAWRAHHRYECEKARERMKSGDGWSIPTLEHRFVEHHIANDIKEHRDQILELYQEYLTAHPEDTAAPVIVLNYSKVPVKTTAISLPEARHLLSDLDSQPKSLFEYGAQPREGSKFKWPLGLSSVPYGRVGKTDRPLLGLRIFPEAALKT